MSPADICRQFSAIWLHWSLSTIFIGFFNSSPERGIEIVGAGAYGGDV